MRARNELQSSPEAPAHEYRSISTVVLIEDGLCSRLLLVTSSAVLAHNIEKHFKVEPAAL
jgi:hypothetical protein